ncbi:MAG: GntR family transcriptional regulator, partial [Desulfobacteraceae bacterium]|nr:GntR family transcriptional regulator [Desulfobacteraceae bacterium]
MNQGDEMDTQKKNPKLEFEGLVAKLESMILTGVFQPRERLIELNLASTLSVSRFWIRDALKILETKGLVTMIPYKGAMVSNLEEDVIEEIFQVRVCLETLATRLACENMKPADVRALRKMSKHIRTCFETEDLESMIASNAAFHDYIFKLSGNMVLLQIINQLKARCH